MPSSDLTLAEVAEGKHEQSGPSGFNERDVDLIPPDVVLDAERVRVRDALAESMDPDMFLSQVPEEEEPHKKEAS